MKIVIGGASGFVGSALVQHFEARGDEVVTLVRGEVGSEAGDGAVTWKPDALELVPKTLAGADAVIVLNGAPIIGKRWTDARKKVLIDSRVKPVRTVVEAIGKLAQQDRPRHLITGSACGIYGSRGDEMLPESASHGTDFLAKVCEAWEAAGEHVRQFGVAHTALRTGLVMGESGGMLPMLSMLTKFGLGGKLGDGQQWMPVISVQDYARAVAHIIEHELTGPVNMGGPNPIRNADFTKALGEHLRRPTLMTVPSFAMRIVLGEQADMALASDRMVPLALMNSGFTFEHPDFQAMLESAE